jgi:hypothetical protein
MYTVSEAGVRDIMRILNSITKKSIRQALDVRFIGNPRLKEHAKNRPRPLQGVFKVPGLENQSPED